MTGRLPPYIAVVRSGERELFRMLKNYLETRGLVQVVWERRVGDRRTLAERRTSRRGESRRQGERRDRLPRERADQLGFFIARRRP